MTTLTISTQVPNNSTWLDVFTRTGSASGVSSFSVTNTDGTITTFNGTNLTYNGTSATTGTITSIVRTSGDGSITYETIAGFQAGVNDSFAVMWNAGGQTGRGSYVFSQADTFTGSTGNDFFRSYKGADTIDGGAGNDMVGYENDSTVPAFAGGPGAGAVIVNLSGAQVIVGADTVQAGTAKDGWGNIDSLTSIEEARGTAGNDFFFGGAGYNLFQGRGGADTYDGGNNVAYFSSATPFSFNWVDYRQETGLNGINVTLTDGTAVPGVDGQGDTGGTGTDTFGAAEVFKNINVIRGSNNADTMVGNSFFNMFEGQKGNDTIDGGGGQDRVNYFNEVRFHSNVEPTQGVIVNLTNAAVTVGAVSYAAHTGTDTWGGTDSLTNIEEINATNFSDTLYGNQSDNKFFTLDGDDVIYLGDGFDYVEAGGGSDIIHGEASAGMDQTFADRDEVSYDDFIGVNGVGIYVDLNSSTLIDPTGAVDTIYDFERVRGTQAADTIIGSNTANLREEMFKGLNGNDIIDGRAGYNVADYSRDFDYAGGQNGIIANLSSAAITVGAKTVEAGTIIDGFGATDTVSYIQSVRGTNFNDYFKGDSNNNSFRLNGGNDTVDGGEGLDTVDMNVGDVFTGNGAIVNLSSQSVTVGAEVVAANTAVSTSGGISTLTGIELVQGSAAADTIYGSAESNAINGWFGNDTIFGGDGNDTINGFQGSNYMDGGDGYDFVSFMYDHTISDYYLQNFPGNNFTNWGGVTVNLANNTATGFDGLTNQIFNIEGVSGTFFNDNITGDGLDNKLRGMSGNDTLDGGAGNDTVFYSPTNQDGRQLVPIIGVNFSRPDGVLVNLSGFNVQVPAGTAAFAGVSVSAGTALDGEGGTDTLTSIENVVGSVGDDTIIASNVSNVINGGDGNDTVIYFGSAADYTVTAINGGYQVVRNADVNDIDFLYNVETVGFILPSQASRNNITVNAFDGGQINLAARGLTDTGTASADDLEGGQGNDSISALGGADYVATGDGNDTILGGTGNDTLESGAGNDSVDGGDDNDTLVAGTDDAGTDTYAGGNGIDTIDYDASVQSVTVNLATGQATGAGIGTDTLQTIENVIGGQGNDDITGNSEANDLEGNLGNDNIDGGDGNDTLQGGSGNDVLIGGIGADALYGDSDDDILRGGAGNDYLNGGANTLAGGDTADFSDAGGAVVAALGVDGDAVVTATGIGTDTLIHIENLTGGSFGDTLTGNAENNVLKGNGGNDSLSGGAGDNVIDGGTGTDTLVETATGGFTLTHTSQIGNGWSVVFGDRTDTVTNVEEAVLNGSNITLRQSHSNFNFGGANDAGATSDILLQNGGTIVNWTIQNNGVAAGTLVGAGVTGWTVKATGDINGDGDADIVLQNGGDIVAWNMQSGAITSGTLLGAGATGWNVVAAADIDGDGDSDLLLQNGGTIVGWTMQNGAVVGGTLIGAGVSGWNVVATGDFYGDGSSDVLLENNGNLVAWNIVNGVVTGGALLGGGLTGWSVKAAGDLNGDGMTDIVLQNGGTIVDWIIQNGVVTAGNVLGTGLTGWNVVASGDYNGDGTSDILLQNGGSIVTWDMLNGVVSGGVLTGAGATGWLVVA